jgi:serine/threonine protein kinase, bacterial
MSLNLYPIIKQLGKGGFGKAFLATNTLMPSRPYCVVKQLIPTSTDPNLQTLIQERFGKEGLVLESLGEQSNGMIPKLYAYFMEEGEFYLVQEYISGQTLLDRVRTNGLFTEIQARQLLTEILPALTYVHSRGMVHRDIKPDNIMLRENSNKPVLIDFGAVKETMSTVETTSGNTGRSIVIGTPGFMPAEQISGRPMFVSDIYALGLTVIYALTGRLPREIEVNPTSGNIDWQVHAPNLSPQLTSILNTAISRIPDARYGSSQDMLNALNGVVAMNPSKKQVAETELANSPTVDIYPPVYPLQQTQYVAPQPTGRGGGIQGNPLVAGVIGVLVGGGLIAGGLILGRNFTDSSSTTTKASPVSEKIDPKSSTSVNSNLANSASPAPANNVNTGGNNPSPSPTNSFVEPIRPSPSPSLSKISNSSCLSDKTFVSAETKNFSVYICGSISPTSYVGVDKRNGKKIILPLSSNQGDKFIAKNGIYTYTITNQSLIVEEGGKMLLKESTTSYQ